jgi:hypothetical protein
VTKPSTFETSRRVDIGYCNIKTSQNLNIERHVERRYQVGLLQD